MQSLFLMTLFVLQSTLSLAQNRTVTGVVVDEKDEPIIGANVTVKGTSKGTITDLDGKFVISAPTNAKLLEVSFIGYNTQTVTITGKTLQIKLTESAIALDEVIAIGYGSAKKGNVTGAIAKVNAEKLEDRAMGKSDQVKKYEFWGLMLFVGIPLPGTGAWTGALVASLLHMKFGKAFGAILVGIALATVIMSILSYGVLGVLFG